MYVSQDPIGLGGGILNLYGYVDDTNAWIDVFGLAPKSYSTTPHGNSKKSNKPQHGYVIYNRSTRQIMEYGISGQALSSTGKSPRISQKIATKYQRNPDIEGKVLNPKISQTSSRTARENALKWEQGQVNSYSVASQRNGTSTAPIAPPMQQRPGVQM